MKIIVRTLYVREDLVFDAFIDSEPVETAKDGSDMAGLRSFRDSTSNRVLGLDTLNLSWQSQLSH